MLQSLKINLHFKTPISYEVGVFLIGHFRPLTLPEFKFIESY